MIVLDASTVLATIRDEHGREPIDALIETQLCAMSAVNASEVFDRMLTARLTLDEARAEFDDLQIRILPVDRRTAELAAALRGHTRERGLGIADRVCIATGMLNEARIFTADRAWEDLDIPEADITVIR